MESLSEARARSEASGRERSIMRCDACATWVNNRCRNGKSSAYLRRTSGEAYCTHFDASAASRSSAKWFRHDADSESVQDDRSGSLQQASR